MGLNVQDIIKERTKETSSVISSTCILSTTIASASQPFIRYLPTMYLRTEDVGLSTKFRFNAESALQPIAGSLPVNRLRGRPNTNLSPGLLYSLRKHVGIRTMLFQC